MIHYSLRGIVYAGFNEHIKHFEVLDQKREYLSFLK